MEFTFPASTKKMLVLALAEACLAKAVVRQVPGISRVYPVAATQDQEARIASEGCNIQGVWEHASEIVNVNEIYTNDVVAILKTYGVEAARSAIIQEMAGVFGAYGIGVDRRHLSLIADYMVCISF
jgi:DNA-directed RNA polymerase I subunit RPA1